MHDFLTGIRYGWTGFRTHRASCRQGWCGSVQIDDLAGVSIAGEVIVVEALIRKSAVAAFNTALLHRFSRRDIVAFDLMSLLHFRMVFEVSSVPLSETTMQEFHGVRRFCPSPCQRALPRSNYRRSLPDIRGVMITYSTRKRRGSVNESEIKDLGGSPSAHVCQALVYDPHACAPSRAPPCRDGKNFFQLTSRPFTLQQNVKPAVPVGYLTCSDWKVPNYKHGRLLGDHDSWRAFKPKAVRDKLDKHQGIENSIRSNFTKRSATWRRIRPANRRRCFLMMTSPLQAVHFTCLHCSG